MLEPRRLTEQMEAEPTLPEGTDERVAGYGVMGLPFRSGHVLAMRRFVASSIGRGYCSVWHRAPSGEWTIYVDTSPEYGCPRYFGPQLRRSFERPIAIRWTGPRSFSVLVDDGRAVQWDVTLASPTAVRAMNALARWMPAGLWRNEAALRMMGTMARAVLGTGRMGLAGLTPSGQRFVANPLVAWTISASRAVIEGADAGDLGPLPQQEHLGDFWIPQRGLFAIGRAFFEPLDRARHRCETHAQP